MGRRAGTPVTFKRGSIYWCRFTVDGKRHFKPLGTGDLDVAERAASKIYAETLLEIRPAPARKPAGPAGSLDEQCARYLAWASTQGRDKRYINEQRIHFKAHFLPRWRGARYITSQAIARYQVERTSGTKTENAVGTVTLYKELVTLSRFLKWCKRDGLIDAVPEFERPTQTSTYEVPNLSPEDVQRFLDELPTRATHPKHYPVQEFARWIWSMGLRFTEAGSIRWSDVDLTGRRLTVRAEIDKAGKDWVLPLTEEARAVLATEAARQHEPGAPIFGIKDVRASFARACERLSFPHVTPHHLRHYRITEWANSTRRLAAVQFMARHLSIATTARYVRSRTEAAEEMLREIEEDRSSVSKNGVSLRISRQVERK